MELIEEDLDLKLKADKDHWVFLYGSDLLQRSIVQGYDADRRYVMERSQIDHPGFRLLDVGESLRKADSPPLACLKACALVDGSYCGEIGYIEPKYYIAIDYLGQQIVKEIKNPYWESSRDRLYQQQRSKKGFKLVVLMGALSLYMLCLASMLLPPTAEPLTEAHDPDFPKELLTPMPLPVQN